MSGTRVVLLLCWGLLVALIVFGVVWFFLVIAPDQAAAQQCAAEHGFYVRRLQTAEQFGAPGDLVKGANIAGFQRVARAMVALGLV